MIWFHGHQKYTMTFPTHLLLKNEINHLFSMRAHTYMGQKAWMSFRVTDLNCIMKVYWFPYEMIGMFDVFSEMSWFLLNLLSLSLPTTSWFKNSMQVKMCSVNYISIFNKANEPLLIMNLNIGEGHRVIRAKAKVPHTAMQIFVH